MKTLLSESGHSSLLLASTVHRANASLEEACEGMASLTLQGLSFSWRQVHLGQGLYARGDGATTHIHEQLHLESIIAGRFLFGDREDSVSLRPGQTLFVLPHHSHNWKCLEGGYMTGCLVDVSGPAKNDFFQTINDERGGMGIVESDVSDIWHRELLKLLSVPSPQVWHVPSLSNLLHLLLIDILSALTDLSPWQPATQKVDPGSRAQDLCRHAMEFLEANYANPIQVQDVAFQTGISPRHLNRLFRQVYGDSVIQVLNRIRLRNAWEMLKEQRELSIKQIAFATGFTQPSYFTACFRKEYGIRPGEIRN